MPLTQPRKRMYAAYNHMPGGQIAVQHFDHVTRERKTGDSTTEKFEITPEEQIRGFEKSDFIAVNVNGTVVRNKVLVYSGPDIAWDDPHSHKRVQEWAEAKGLAPIRTAAEQKKSAGSDGEARIDLMEGRIVKLEKRAEESGQKIDQILEAVTARK